MNLPIICSVNDDILIELKKEDDMSGQKGFSLVETMVTAAVICVMSTFSYPSFMTLRQAIENQAVVDSMIADLNLAKFTAIKKNSYVVMQLMKDGYVIFIDDGEGGGKAGDWILQKDEKLLLEKNLETSIQLSSNFKKDHLRFRGVVGMSPGTITIENSKGKTSKIIINRVGRLRQNS